MQLLREIHDELLLSVAKAGDQLGARGLTTFFPMRGDSPTASELMVVGRAVNGGRGKEWAAKDALRDECRAKIVQEFFDRRDPLDPLKWMQETWGSDRIRGHALEPNRKRPYNAKLSAFLRVISSVAQWISGSTDNWHRSLIWSNLYKVSPFERGNPSIKLRRAQLESCQRHLEAEVALWKPKRILFLTRLDWYEPFVACIGKAHSGERGIGHVQWSGKFELLPKEFTTVVVSFHPQRRKHVDVTEEIKKHFQKWHAGPAGPSL